MLARLQGFLREPRGVAVVLALCAWLEPSSRAGAATAIWQFRTFRARDGLAHDIVRDVLPARDGTIWFATMGGVTRYDPRACSYQTFSPGESLPRQQAMALAQGRDGAIWVATQGGGVARYLRGTWRWFTTSDGLPSDEIAALLVDSRGRVWATPTVGGMAVFSRGRWRNFGPRQGLSRGEIGRCGELSDGTIACATYERPLLQLYADGRWSQMRISTSVERAFYPHALLEDRNHRLWVATKGAGVLEGTRLSGGGYRWTAHDRQHGLPSNRVGAVFEARDGAIWVATSAGVSRFRDGHWHHFSQRSGLGGSHVFAIAQSRRGAMWFATLGGGASRYAPSRWERVTAGAGLASDNLTGGLLVARDGALWTGSDRGIDVLRDGRWQQIRAGDVALDHVEQLLQTRDGAIWAATHGGLRRWKHGRWTVFSASTAGGGDSASSAPGAGATQPSQPVVRALAPDGRGGLWIATARGLSHFDGRRWRDVKKARGLSSRRIYDLLVDRRGRLWVATDNGVARAERVGGALRWRRYLQVSPASRTHRVYRLVEDARGRIWASGLEGVDRWSKTGFERVDLDPWLPGGIYSRFAMHTRDGSLWFAVRGLGVLRLRRGRWSAYSTASGLASDTVRDVAVRDAGTVLFATLGGGLSRYRPDRHPPQTHIGAGPRPGAPRSALQGEELLISFGGQDVFKDTPTARLRFSYRVDQGPWSAFSRATRARLSGLTAGRHRFEVRAMDRDLNVDPTPAVHSFAIIVPWWRSSWLWTLSGLSLLALGYAGLRIVRAVRRERAAIAQEQQMVDQRRRFVRLASHELRKPLTRLAHRAEMLELAANEGDPAMAGSYAAAIESESKQLAQLVESLLDQAGVEQGLRLRKRRCDLRQIAREAVEQVREAADARPSEGAVELSLPADRLEVSCDPFYLSLALRNLLDNALKYGEGSPVSLEIAPAGARATLRVRDQGPGIAGDEHAAVFEPFFRGRTSPEHGGFGLGLSFAREIARAHGGDLTLSTAEQMPSGCTFELTLPRGPEPEESDREDGATADHR